MQLPQHTILSPSEITKIATKFTFSENRTFPNHGLGAIEMARAVREVGLEPEPVQIKNMYMLQSTAYAYLRARIPLILGVEVVDLGKKTEAGDHAVALTGYNLCKEVKCHPDHNGIPLVANHIDKFYAHDDQLGPFARMLVDGIVGIERDTLKDPKEGLSTSWYGGCGVAYPNLLLIPLYNKIRIRYRMVYREICILHKVVMKTLSLKYPDGLGDVEWDVYLTTINDLKAELSSLDKIPDRLKLHLLKSRMPRFIWRATGLIGGKNFLDIFMDATGITQGSMLIDALPYDNEEIKYVMECSASIDSAAIFSSTVVQYSNDLHI